MIINMMEIKEEGRKMDDGTQGIIWERMKRSHSELKTGRRPQTIEENIRKNVSGLEKLLDPTLIEFASHYGHQLGHKLTVQKTPFEPYTLEKEIKPLTARLKRSYLNVATLDQVRFQRSASTQETAPTTQATDFQDESDKIDKEVDECNNLLIQKYLKKKFFSIDKKSFVKTKRVVKEGIGQQIAKKAMNLSILQRHGAFGPPKDRIKTIFASNSALISRQQIVSPKIVEEQTTELYRKLHSQLKIRNLNEDSSGQLQRSRTLKSLNQVLKLPGADSNATKRWMTSSDPKPIGQQFTDYFKKTSNPKSSMASFKKHVADLPKAKYVTVIDHNKNQIKALKRPKGEYLKNKRIFDLDFNSHIQKTVFNPKTGRFEDYESEVEQSTKLGRSRANSNLSHKSNRSRPGSAVSRASSGRSKQSQKFSPLHFEKFDSAPPRMPLYTPLEKKAQSSNDLLKIVGAEHVSHQMLKARFRKALLSKIEKTIEEQQEIVTMERKIKQQEEYIKSYYAEIEKREGQKLLDNLLHRELTRKDDPEEQNKPVPNFMRQAFKAKLDSMKVNLVKEGMSKIKDKLLGQAKHFEQLNKVCTILDACEKNQEIGKDDKQGMKALAKADQVLHLNDEILDKMHSLLNKRMEEINYSILFEKIES